MYGSELVLEWAWMMSDVEWIVAGIIENMEHIPIGMANQDRVSM